MKLTIALLAAVALVTFAPLASADRYLCQPLPGASVCATVVDSNGWVYAEACEGGSTGYLCVGGGHWDYSPTPYIGNGAGLEMCQLGTCGGAVVGQESYFGMYDAYAGAGGYYAGSTGAVVFARAGTNNGAPFVDLALCQGTPVTGGPSCVLV